MLTILGVVLLVPWALLTAQDTAIKSQPIPTYSGPTASTLRTISIPTVDISGDARRHVVVAQGWREIGLDTKHDVKPGPFRYRVEIDTAKKRMDHDPRLPHLTPSPPSSP